MTTLPFNVFVWNIGGAGRDTRRWLSIICLFANHGENYYSKNDPFYIIVRFLADHFCKSIYSCFCAMKPPLNAIYSISKHFNFNIEDMVLYFSVMSLFCV